MGQARGREAPDDLLAPPPAPVEGVQKGDVGIRQVGEAPWGAIPVDIGEGQRRAGMRDLAPDEETAAGRRCLLLWKIGAAV